MGKYIKIGRIECEGDMCIGYAYKDDFFMASMVRVMWDIKCRVHADDEFMLIPRTDIFHRQANLPSELMHYFNVNVEEFKEFWKSLRYDEREYFRYADLYR